MAIDQVDRTVVTEGPSVGAVRETTQTDSRRITRAGPGASEMTRRVIVLVFGLIQILIAARFILLVVDAREANGLVSGILNFSQIFVAPFDGILRTDSLHAAGSVLDFTAISGLFWSGGRQQAPGVGGAAASFVGRPPPLAPGPGIPPHPPRG